jgi:hypothetical protein
VLVGMGSPSPACRQGALLSLGDGGLTALGYRASCLLAGDRAITIGLHGQSGDFFCRAECPQDLQRQIGAFRLSRNGMALQSHGGTAISIYLPFPYN